MEYRANGTDIQKLLADPEYTEIQNVISSLVLWTRNKYDGKCSKFYKKYRNS